MTVGYFAPLPPARTGVAEYAAGLLAGLRTHGDVRVNDPDTTVALYQIGNNHLHREIYQQALERPGVVLLHDAVLQHFFLGWLAEDIYVEEFVYNYGEWTRELARELYRQRAHSGMDQRFFQYPMLRRLIETSRAVVVHNGGAARLVRRHGPDARVFELPHFFGPPAAVDEGAVLQVREKLAVPSDGTLFGIFGHLRETKRLTSAIRAFHSARAANAKLRLLLAGTPASRELARFLDAAATDLNIVRRDYLSEERFWSHAAAVDACINLRYPTAGETSGIGIRLMGIGKPVIFTEGPEVADYPAGSCLRVDAGSAEEATLAAYLLWLAEYPGDAAAVGQAAANHIKRYHDLRAVSAALWQILSRFAD